MEGGPNSKEFIVLVVELSCVDMSVFNDRTMVTWLDDNYFWATVEKTISNKIRRFQGCLKSVSKRTSVYLVDEF